MTTTDRVLPNHDIDYGRDDDDEYWTYEVCNTCNDDLSGSDLAVKIQEQISNE